MALCQLLFIALILQRGDGFQGSPVSSRQQPPLFSAKLETKPEVALPGTALDSLVENGNPPELLLADSAWKNEADEETERMKKTMLFLCFGVALLSALDRVAMSVAMLPLSAEFGYSDTMKGSVSSLFSVGYGLGIVPAGIVVATASPRFVMACGIAVWSFATIATPYAAAYHSMAPLLVARASVGAAESVVLPTLQTLLCSWTSKEEKSRSLAAVFSGFHTGTVAAFLISPLLIEYLGWRNLFLTFGGLGFCFLLPWLLLAKDRPPTPMESKQDQYNSGVVVDVAVSSVTTANSGAALAASEAPSGKMDLMEEISKSVETLKAAPWGGFLKSRGTWAMGLAHACNNWGLYNNLSWSPTFYSEQYGLSVRDSALYSVLPSIAGAIGGLVAGSLSDSLLQNLSEEEDEAKRIQATTNLRKAFQGAALGIPAVALFTLSSHIPEQPWVAQSLLMATTGLQAFNSAGYLSANQEKAGEKWAGLLYSITSLPAVMVGTTGVYLTGQILDYTNQDWSVVFALNAAIFVLGATSFVTLYDSKREFD